MSFGPDIEELLDEIGIAYTVVRDSGNVTGEKLLYKSNQQVTKPFIREFFLEAIVAYNSVIVGGDIISFSDGRVFLVCNSTPNMFENETVRKDAVLYKCNVSGELERYAGEGWGTDYRQSGSWQTVKSNVYAMMTEELFGNILDERVPAGQTLETAYFLYLPANSGIQSLDRYVPFSGEQPYKVKELDKYKFDGVWVANLEMDTRE